MKDGNQIEIYYHYSDLDKEHCYSVVCRERENGQNFWAWWIWYKMGEQFTAKEKKSFRIYPFNFSWNPKEKLIKEYKTINFGNDLVVPAIKKHFKSIKLNQKQ